MVILLWEEFVDWFVVDVSSVVMVVLILEGDGVEGVKIDVLAERLSRVEMESELRKYAPMFSKVLWAVGVVGSGLVVVGLCFCCSFSATARPKTSFSSSISMLVSRVLITLLVVGSHVRLSAALRASGWKNESIYEPTFSRKYGIRLCIMSMASSATWGRNWKTTPSPAMK